MGEDTGGTPEWSEADLERWPGLKNWGKPHVVGIDWAKRFLENMRRSTKTGETDDPLWGDDGDD